MKKINIILLVLIFASTTALNSTNFDFETVITATEKAFSKIKDYTCKFSKRDLINGEYFANKDVIFKFKKPGQYYMKYTEGSMKDAEVIYAGKKYNNNLRIHLGGLLKIVDLELDPKGNRAMEGNRHSILESDFGFVINLIKSNYLKAKKNKEGSIKHLKVTKVDGKKVNLYEAIFPKGKGYYSHKIYVYLDVATKMPVKFSIYDWDNKVIERFEIKDLKLNTGLKAIDFDVDNPKYGF